MQSPNKQGFIKLFQTTDLFPYIYETKDYSRQLEDIIFRAFHSKDTTELEDFMERMADELSEEIKYEHYQSR